MGDSDPGHWPLPSRYLDPHAKCFTHNPQATTQASRRNKMEQTDVYSDEPEKIA
jgi:hypothetical protein